MSNGERNHADHENTIAFGPCEGPIGDPGGGSFFCQGNGTEYVDPLDPFGANVIVCYPCFSHREAQIITENLERVLAA